MMSPLERLRRHVRVNGTRSLLAGISTSAVVAGFLDATQHTWPLLGFLALTAGFAIVVLIALGVRRDRGLSRLLLVPGANAPRSDPGRPRRLELVAVSPRPPLRQIEAAGHDDPVYRAGLRVLVDAPSRPLIVIPSNRRDVGREHELLLPIFADRQRRSRVEVDLRPFGIPLAPYEFERELPEGVQDVDHTLAVKDLVFVPELAAALRGPAAALDDAPLMWPEHCVDPGLLAERDVVVIGGPDTNFWHGALFEPVVREFTRPVSSIPLAMDLRDESGGFPIYGSRTMTVQLGRSEEVFPYGRNGRVEMDERLYPTYAMILACRNPFAAAIGRSHWCVFVAGTRSLGTSGAVLALASMLQGMRADPDLNYVVEVPTESVKVNAQVSAALCRTIEVEQAALQRDAQLSPRQRRRLPAEGLDSHYSDSYIPVEVEYLSYADGPPRWSSLSRIAP
jgi:hypothetical protein